MYILTRHIVTETLKNFVVTLLALTLIVTLGMGFKEGLNMGLTPMVILKTIPYIIPEMLVITIPVSLLLAVCIVFGRMTGNNEVVALKSLGINPWEIILPVLVVAFFLSLCTIYLQETAATWSRPSRIREAAASLEEIVYGYLQKSHSYASRDFDITVKRVKGRKLLQPTITIHTRNNTQTVTIRAAEAELKIGPSLQGLNVICRDAEVDVDGKIWISRKTEFRYTIPLPPTIRPEFHRDWVAMYEISDLVAELKDRMATFDQERQKHLAAKEPLPEKLQKEIDYFGSLLHRLETEPYRRVSNGFTCLCFTLIGAPVAMLWRHADVLTNFFVCFLPILAVYYPLLMFGEDLSTSGALPPIFFWSANAAMLVPAFFLMRWVIRH
ncbi:MAG: LptF/LptG family permease [Pirellulales bacterium]|nr:LptF/LptG family permease [Pirellulales bacterium]